MITHKSDVWSGCVTMMIVLVSKKVNVVPHTLVHIAYYVIYVLYEFDC